MRTIILAALAALAISGCSESVAPTQPTTSPFFSFPLTNEATFQDVSGERFTARFVSPSIVSVDVFGRKENASMSILRVYDDTGTAIPELSVNLAKLSSGALVECMRSGTAEWKAAAVFAPSLAASTFRGSGSGFRQDLLYKGVPAILIIDDNGVGRLYADKVGVVAFGEVVGDTFIAELERLLP